MKNLSATLVLFLISISAYCQQDFRKGYIIQNSDTINGFVDYRGDKRSAQTTSYKRTLESDIQTFTPTDISGYGFDAENKIFESKMISSAKPDTASQTLFLNALVKGKASLYYYRDEDEIDRYYLSIENGPLAELLQQEYRQKDPTTGKTYIATSKIFIGTLSNAFSDCNTIKNSQLHKLRFSQGSLIDIIAKYNHCVQPESVSHKQERKKAEVAIGPVISISNSSLKFSGDSYLEQAPFSSKAISVGGGLSMNVSLPRLNEKVSFQLDLLYIADKYTAHHEEKIGNIRTSYDATFDLGYLKLPIQVRYTFPKGAIRPFINAGGLIGYAIKDDNQVVKTTTLGSLTRNSTYAAIPGNETVDGFRNFMEGVTAGAGVMYPFQKGTLTLEARYEKNNGMSSITAIGSTISTFYMLLGYSF